MKSSRFPFAQSQPAAALTDRAGRDDLAAKRIDHRHDIGILKPDISPLPLLAQPKRGRALFSDKND